MGWADHNINWASPGSHVSVGGACRIFAAAINERYAASNFADAGFKSFPLIAITAADNNPSSTISRGRRQYKMYEGYNNFYEPFNVRTTDPLYILTNALINEFAWIFARTDITDYTLGSLPQDIKQLSLLGFPQVLEASNPGSMDDLEWAESLNPSCNDIGSRIRSNDSSLFTSLGYLKKEIVTEFWELLKVYKYMFYTANEGDTQRLQIVNEDVSTFPATYSALSYSSIFFNDFPTNRLERTGSQITEFSLHNSQKIDELGDTIFTSAPDLVTTPKYQMVQTGADGNIAECLSPGFYEANVVVDGTEVTADLYSTSGGAKPASITLPAAGQAFGTSLRHVTTGSGITIDSFCYDLETTEDLEYPVDGT